MFLKWNNIQNLIAQSSITMVAAIGTAFVMTHNNLDFSLGGACALCCVLSYLIVGNNLWLFFILCIIFGVLCGLFSAVLHVKGEVPAFLGSSFAYLAGYWAIAPNGEAELLPYACFGVAVSGLMYVILAAIIKSVGVKKVMRFFPPIVTGPIIIAIGLILSSSAINNCEANWLVAVVAIVVVIACNMWGKGMIKIIPILIGVLTSYVVSMIVDPASRAVVAQKVSEAAWIGLPVHKEATVFGLLSGNFDSGMLVTACVTIVPLAIATMMEHVGDICAISSTVGKNYIVEPGLNRTLMGDGLATTLASLFGAPANTTYGENTGVLALSKVYDPRVIRLAALFAIILSFCPKFAALVTAMPTATIGGVSMILYGMISAVGVRNVVENRVDFTNTRNVIIAALILVLALGISNSTAGAVHIGSVSLSGLAVASLVGILVNAILPGKDYEFGVDIQGDTSVNFKV